MSKLATALIGGGEMMSLSGNIESFITIYITICVIKWINYLISLDFDLKEILK